MAPSWQHTLAPPSQTNTQIILESLSPKEVKSPVRGHPDTRVSIAEKILDILEGQLSFLVCSMEYKQEFYIALGGRVTRITTNSPV